MSADNGIYVGRFPKGKSYEWRVIHAQAIENCDDSPEYPKEVIDAYRVWYWGDGQVFKTEKKAAEYAFATLKKHTFTEYGICYIEYDRPLVKLTMKEAEQLVDKWFTENHAFGAGLAPEY